MVGYNPIDWPLERPGDGPCVVRGDGARRYIAPDMKTAVRELDLFHFIPEHLQVPAARVQATIRADWESYIGNEQFRHGSLFRP